jgi:hypothetical protein
MMWVNNETGVRQPSRRSPAARRAGVLLHSDGRLSGFRSTSGASRTLLTIWAWWRPEEIRALIVQDRKARRFTAAGSGSGSAPLEKRHRARSARDATTLAAEEAR